MHSTLRPSPAMVIALIALFVSLGGTAAALSGSNTVFTDDIVDNQVYSADVRNDTLSGGGLAAPDLKPNAVGTSEVANGSILSTDIQADAVTTAQVRDDDFPGGGLTFFDLANPSVGSGEIFDGSVGSNDIGSGAVTAGKLAVDSVDQAAIRANQVAASEIAADAVGVSELASLTVVKGDPVTISGGTAQDGAYSTGSAFVNCPTDTIVISGGAEWSGVGANEEVWIQSIQLSGSAVTVRGGNDSGTARSLVAIARCLGPGL